MAWLRIDDRVRTHPKIIQAGPEAAWLWFCGLCYCREHLTDGRIDKVMLPMLAIGVRNPKRQAARLVELVLWHDKGDHFEVHDFLDWNPTRADIDAGREWDRRRKELYADPALVQAIRIRDGDECRYCGVTVNWRDRRGPTGGQFDHVTPRGPNTIENIVVACRRCNIGKNNRTPDEAGMVLRTPKNLVQNQIRTSSDLGLDLDSDLVPSESGSRSPSRDRAGALARARALSSDLSGSEKSARETTNPDDVAAFLDGYRERYHRITGGTLPLVVNGRDLAYVAEMLQTWPLARLLDMAEVFLHRDDRDVLGKPKTIPFFKPQAPWCDTRLREAGR